MHWNSRIGLLFALVFGLMFCGSFAALHANELPRTDAPDWVVDARVPEAREQRLPQVTGGLYYLLNDRQYLWRPGQSTRYHRIVAKVIDRQGLEDAAEIKLNFDPADELLRLHHITITRGSEILDRTDVAEFATFRRETELSAGILNGELTAHTNLKDVRVGDIVDYAYSVEKTSLLFNDYFATAVQLRFSDPIGLDRVQVLVPRDTVLQFRKHNLDVDTVLEPMGELKRYEWSVRDPEPIPGEKFTPEWYPHWGYVEISSWPSWSSVVEAITPFYKTSDRLPEEFAARVDAIAERFSSTGDRITEALRLVQDSIRYVGIENGHGGYVPRRPELVIERGFGDCKDKTLLLLSILARLEITAVPALTDTKEGPGLSDRLPSHIAFNHVIVRATDGAQTYWLDPTASHEGGRGTEIDPPRYGYALPIEPGTEALQEIPPPDDSSPTISVSEDFTFPETAENPVTLTVSSQYFRESANAMRLKLASQGHSRLERSYLNYYDDQYPGIETAAPMTVTDNRDGNRISIEESYVLPQAALRQRKLLRNFPVRPDAINGLLPKPPKLGRTAPVALFSQGHYEQTIRLHEPLEGFKGEEPKHIDNDIFTFDQTTLESGSTVRFRWQLKTKASVVPLDSIDTYLRDVEWLENNTSWTYNFSNYIKMMDSESQRSATGELDQETESENENREYIASIATYVSYAILFTLMVLGTRYGLKADAAYADESFYFPVDRSKFTVMSIATLGLYPLFWLWKFWRWERRNSAQQIRPFWRAVFGIFWLYPAFEIANAKAYSQPLPKSLGIAGAVYFLVTSLVSIAADITAYDPHFIFTGIGMTAFIGCLPAVTAVNKLNRGGRLGQIRNSKYNAWNIVGIVLGAIAIVAVAANFLT